MKYVISLSESEQVTLKAAMESGPTPRFRQRARAIYLSHKGFTVNQLSSIFEVDRDTVSAWLDKWERRGLAGLVDAPRPGRPRNKS